MKKKTLISISRKTFFSVIALLLGLLTFSIILTYIVPKGDFGTLADGSVNYLEYIPRENQKDLEDVPAHVLSAFEIIPADSIGDVLAVALLPREREE